jgi:hypothetical protein
MGAPPSEPVIAALCRAEAGLRRFEFDVAPAAAGP